MTSQIMKKDIVPLKTLQIATEQQKDPTLKDQLSTCTADIALAVQVDVEVHKKLKLLVIPKSLQNDTFFVPTYIQPHGHTRLEKIIKAKM